MTPDLKRMESTVFDRQRNLLALTAVLLQILLVAPAGAQERRASVWVTSTDATKLLAKQADVPLVTHAVPAQLTISLDDTKTFQQIDGFGASLTESSAWL